MAWLAASQHTLQEQRKFSSTGMKNSGKDKVPMVTNARQSMAVCVLNTLASSGHIYVHHLLATRKTIYLFRDPADLIWASWNFWVDEHWDAIPSTKSNWAQPGHHYRSPELFHEIIKAGDLSYSYRKYVGSHKYHMVCTVKNLLQIYGRENVLFLRNEDMLPTEIEKSGLLDKLSGFTGLDRDKFNSTMVHERTNCNDDKGATVECSNPTKTLAYEISGNRTMFPETRQLIYLDFLEECKIMKREFGVEYPECLGVLDKR